MGGDPGSWQQFGAFGMVCVVLVWIILDQRRTISEQRKELREVRDQLVTEVVPLATRMLDALHDASEIVKAAATKGRGGS